jgi:hypothetical protein
MKKASLCFGSVVLSLFFVFLTLTPASALDVKISGQVNQMVIWADNGDVDDFFIADNDNSSTRIRATGEEAFGNIKAGFQFEIEAQRNASNNVVFEQTTDGGFEWNDRWFNVYFATPFGKIEIGKGDAAANNTTEVDLSGTAVINYSDVGAFSSGLAFENATTIGSTRSNMDGALSRTQRLRYNTPVFAGFMLAGSVSNGDAWDASAWYSATLGGNRLAAAIGYTKMEDRSATIEDQWGGSISWLAPFGLNLTAAYGVRNFEGLRTDDATNWYGKVGYRFDIHAFSIEYGETKDLRVAGEKGTNWGVAYVVNPWKPVEFYVSYRHFMLDAELGPDPDDIQVAGAGTRIRF